MTRTEVRTNPSDRSVSLPQVDGCGSGPCPDPLTDPCMVIPVSGMRSAASARAIERTMRDRYSLVSSASFASGSVRVHLPSDPALLQSIGTTLARQGYVLKVAEARRCPGVDFVVPADGEKAPQHSNWMTPIHDSGILALILVLFGGAFLLGGFIARLSGAPAAVWIPLLSLSAVLTSLRTFPNAIEAVRDLSVDIDVLMFVAAAGAASLGHYEEGAFLLFLFGLGNAGEHLALGRARQAITALKSVAPDTARILTPDGERVIPAEDVKPGDRVLVLPFERLPADGVITQGECSIEQSAITGESMPVAKREGDEVFAGTINGDARIIVRVSRPTHDSTIARVIRMVELAETEKSPAQLLTDRIEKWYVPGVLLATLLAIIVLPLAFSMGWGESFYRSMAFLTAASPCAIAIGGPAAVLCGIARSARVGVLVKGGGPLETLARVDAVFFDKTGTLTIGKPLVVGIHAADGTSEDDLLAIAAGVEASTSHPLADAIVRAAEERELAFEPALHVRQITGEGAEGRFGDSTVRVGRLRETHTAQIDARTRDSIGESLASGSTVVGVIRDDVCIGAIAIADGVREESVRVIELLGSYGIRDIRMLTGDRESVARAVGSRVGIQEIHADLLPQDKLDVIKRCSESRVSAMVGDGVNDAPALAAADVGIAVGGIGSDVAMETADIVLARGSVERLPDAVRISRMTRAVTMQNLVIAMGVIGLVAPLALAGYATLGLAVLLHEGSTVVVVLNALRILGVRKS